MHALPQQQVRRAIQRGYSAESLEMGCRYLLENTDPFFHGADLEFVAQYECFCEKLQGHSQPINAFFFRYEEELRWDLLFNWAPDETVQLLAIDEAGNQDLVIEMQLTDLREFRSSMAN